jgi:MOSC domain-containing protein
MCELRVTGLHTYPVKSCAGVNVTQARVTRRGLELDRDLMVVDGANVFVSQRTVPELALVSPSIGEHSIALSAPGMQTVHVPRAARRDDRGLVAATVHGRPVSGQIVGEELNEWFTTFLPRRRTNERFRLLRVRDDAPRYIDDAYRKPGAANQVGFADGGAMLLATEPSLAALNAELDERVPMNRFRPNIVVDGAALEPYDEDFWLTLEIGALSAFVVKACDRCSIPDTDQGTAAVGKTVRRALRARRGVNAHDPSNRGVFFAQNLNHVYAPGVVVRVGDPVRVLSRGAVANVVLDRGRATRPAVGAGA